MDPHAAMFRRLLSVFSSEAAERIHRVNGALLALEREDETTDRTDALTGIMRELHTLKGAGGSVNLEDVELLSHDLESVFGPVLEGERELSPAIFAVAYRTLDAIGELIAAAVQERPPAVDVPALVAEMHAAADGSGAGSPPTAEPTSVADEAPNPVVDEANDTPTSTANTEGDAEDTDATADRSLEEPEDPSSDADVDNASLLASFAELQSPFDEEHSAFGEELSALADTVGAAEGFGDTHEEATDGDTATQAVEPAGELELESEIEGEIEGEFEAEFEAEFDGEGEYESAAPTPTEIDAADVVTKEDVEVEEPTPPEVEGFVEPAVVAASADDDRAAPAATDEGSREATPDAPEPDAEADAGRARVLAVFATESRERVKRINRNLMALERGPDDASRAGTSAVSEILRELHTLKGSSATVHDTTVESLAHQLEALFGAVRDGFRQLDAPIFDIAYRALDAVETAVNEAARGETTDVDAEAWTETIRAAIGRSGSGTEPASTPTNSFNEAASMLGGGGAEDTVRLAISKLDALMGSVSELQVARAGTEQHLADARAMMTGLSSIEAAWLETESRVRRLIAPATTEDGAENVLIAPEPAELEELESFLADGRQRIGEARTHLVELLRAMESDGRRLAQLSDDLQDDVRRARMLPVSMVFDAFPRLIRDLAVDLGKRATLVVEGADTEVDRSVIEQIRAPLTHLLRNAIDHGLETPEGRERAGKPAEGTITLSASQRGDTLLVEVRDDGAGIDPAKIRAHAVERRTLSQEAADVTNDADALRLIFRAGFSTRGVVTDLSGRGVGLDVVRDAIERLRGSVEVDSVIGEGTHFSLQVPLSVASAQCVMVGVSGSTFALPISNVNRILRLTKDQTERADGRLVVPLDGDPTPISSVAEVLGLERGQGPVNGSPHPAVVLASGERRIVFVVDELIGTQTLVLKSLPAPLVRLRNISGAAVLGTGEVVGVLNAADLVRRDDPAGAWSTSFGGNVSSGEGGPDAPMILVVDDSSVTRTMVKGILETAGFRVQVAADGMQAWELLRSRPFDLLVSDVNMPEMSGFDLTEKVRSDRLLRHVPVILVTALDSMEDQAHGADVGADAYITKGAFNDDRLIEAVRNFV
jgi:two-component system, chemotaxis family, sensor kinase CheA